MFFESDEKLKKWFYGLRYYIDIKNLKIKMKTKFDFILSKLKMRLLREILEFNQNHPEVKKNKEIVILNDIKLYAKNNNFQFESLSIVKVILLYLKLMKLNK